MELLTVATTNRSEDYADGVMKIRLRAYDLSGMYLEKAFELEVLPVDGPAEIRIAGNRFLGNLNFEPGQSQYFNFGAGYSGLSVSSWRYFVDGAPGYDLTNSRTGYLFSPGVSEVAVEFTDLQGNESVGSLQVICYAMERVNFNQAHLFRTFRFLRRAKVNYLSLGNQRMVALVPIRFKFMILPIQQWPTLQNSMLILKGFRMVNLVMRVFLLRTTSS